MVFDLIVKFHQCFFQPQRVKKLLKLSKFLSDEQNKNVPLLVIVSIEKRKMIVLFFIFTCLLLKQKHYLTALQSNFSMPINHRIFKKCREKELRKETFRFKVVLYTILHRLKFDQREPHLHASQSISALEFFFCRQHGTNPSLHRSSIALHSSSR